MRIAIVLALALTACTQTATPDMLELRNIRQDNIIPKSTPSTFVSTFKTFCMAFNGDLAAMDRRLRAADYVPLPRNNRGVRTYLVDTRRPAVMLTDTGCVVAAASRTGQTERVQSFVSAEFPDAVAFPAEGWGKDAEQAWILPSRGKAVLFTLRQIGAPEGSRYGFGIIFPPGSS